MNFIKPYKSQRSALWKTTLLFILVSGLLIATDQISIRCGALQPLMFLTYEPEAKAQMKLAEHCVDAAAEFRQVLASPGYV
jgi:hypothetical protein